MKRNIIKSALFVFGIILFTGCSNDFEDMNHNPNGVSEIDDPTLYIPKMEQMALSANYVEYQQALNLYSNLYCQWVSNTNANWNTDRYGFTNSWAVTGFWNPYYVYVLKNALEIKRMFEAGRTDFEELYHISRIICAMGTAMITDTFGDIPYSEASRGNEKCKYDSQKDIYYDILKELREAATALANANYNGVQQKKCGNNDLIFGGDVSKWIKFGNSLRLRYALRISFVDPDKAKQEGEAALATNNLMANINDNAGYKTSDLADSDHPMTVICYWNEFRMSQTLSDAYQQLSSVSDPRMLCYWGYTQATINSTDKKIQGLKNGLPSNQLAGVTSTNSNVWGLLWFPSWNSSGQAPGGWVATPYYAMRYSEVCFLKSEAAIRNWAGAGDAQTNYENGIKASFDEARLGVNSAFYSTANDILYYTTGKVKWDNGDNFESKLEKIATQKWISLFPYGHEGWAEIRRTGYPKLNPVAASDEPTINPANGEFIKKLRYIDIEKKENSDNANASSLNGGKGDGPNVRVWWDTGRYK